MDRISPGSTPTDDLLSIEQAAVLLQIQPRSVQHAIRRGALPTVGVDTAWLDSPPHLRRPDVEAYAINRQTWKSKVPWPLGRPVH